VERERVEFVGRQSWAGYVSTYERIDIALDPYPYGGGITSCDALWMGAPVVSLRGRTSVGRGGCSILGNLGLKELVGATPEEYVQIAVELGKDLGRLQALRRGLRERMERSPLRDAKGLAHDLETAYRKIWRKWCKERLAR
jgi:predicted O-linked N-acetylglucosamine transferase (SPINDLY family)